MSRGGVRTEAKNAAARVRALVALLVLGVVLSGCSFKGLVSLPLPGGVDTGSHPYRVKIDFANVLDLVPQSQCRVNGVPVGNITRVELKGWHARVTCELRGSIRLPANAVATISQTSLLGEKFVALSAPQGRKSVGELTGGAVIPISRTTRTTEVEEVLSALSLLVTGGGLQQISTITHELNAAMEGHTQQMRDVLEQLDTFVGTLDRQKNQIVTTIKKLDRLTRTLAKHNKEIVKTIDSTEPALKILASQRADLTKLLVNMDKLGKVASRTIKRSKDDTIANLKSLQTVLTNTNKVGEIIPDILAGLFTFPFPDTVAGALKGDYGNLDATLDLNVHNIAHNFLAGTPLEGLVKTSQKLLAVLSPPHTGFSTPPLGVLPRVTLGSPEGGGSRPTGESGAGLPPLGMGEGAANGDLAALLRGGTI